MKDHETQVQERIDNARNLAALLGAMQATYFAALSISQVKASLRPLELLPFFAPFIFWTVGLVLTFLLWASPKLKPWKSKAEQRDRWLASARWIWGFCVLLFFVGLLWMSGMLTYYFFFLPLPPP